jgi:uncharacterized C2H2 Zn-finger protein
LTFNLREAINDVKVSLNGAIIAHHSHNRLELKEHIRTEHADDNRRCSHCNFIGATVASRQAHEKAMHLNRKCRQCGKFFASESLLASHECAKPVKLQCSECDKKYASKKELKDHVNFVHKGLKHTCPECNAALACAKNLNRHMRTVHQALARRFPCPVPYCDKTLKDKRTLANHVKTHDRTERPDPCPDCGKIFASTDSLRQHVKIVHEKNFKQVFPSISQLRTHGEMVHMRGSLQICHLCGKEVLGENRLRNHMQRSHPKGQEFANCEYCNKVIKPNLIRNKNLNFLMINR